MFSNSRSHRPKRFTKDYQHEAMFHNPFLSLPAHMNHGCKRGQLKCLSFLLSLSHQQGAKPCTLLLTNHFRKPKHYRLPLEASTSSSSFSAQMEASPANPLFFLFFREIGNALNEYQRNRHRIVGLASCLKRQCLWQTSAFGRALMD